MRSGFILPTLAATVPSLGGIALAGTPLANLKRGVENTYILTPKDAVALDDFKSTLVSRLTNPSSAAIYDLSISNALVVKLNPADLALVRVSIDAEDIEYDEIISLSEPQEFLESQASAMPLGKRESCPEPSFVEGGGKGVTIYNIGTGVKTDHECFGGRAKWGRVFGDYNMMDDSGHGTHSAGIAIGNYYGVARGANVVAIKGKLTESSYYFGSMINALSGIDYACAEFKKQDFPPSIIYLPMNGGGSKAWNSTINNCAKMGMHFVVSAGNGDSDAKVYTPAQIPMVNTIGAINSTCYKAPYSNFGSIIDAHALGVDIASAGIGPGSNATKVASGTSLAASYVTGILAVVLEKYGKMSPGDLTAAMKANAYKGALDFPENTTTDVAKLW
ncbi:Subtilisin-like protease 4 [Rhizoctonia solani]|uniref:Subtilisin-like protease 4 n=1 Tax=Rhizoctonia solani TaxID=456999 RepID=A0A0K6G4D0_9AGAM|nr:Subtilisin-like protease 4 [Rhizoctonia solani]